MRTFLVGVVAIVGCAFGNAQTFDFHALTVAGHSKFIQQNDALKESLQKEGSRAAISMTLPQSIAASGAIASVPETPPARQTDGPPLGAIMVGAVCVLIASGGCLRHVVRRQSATA